MFFNFIKFDIDNFCQRERKNLGQWYIYKYINISNLVGWSRSVVEEKNRDKDKKQNKNC